MGDTEFQGAPARSNEHHSAEAVSEAQALAQLERVLASGIFGKAERLSDFLQFIVREAAAGRGNALKEYTIALEVFGRPESFDPRTDSGVRVAARAIRSRLREYYETRGRHDPVVIELPKGGYAPVFRAQTPAVAAGLPGDGTGSSRVARRRLIWAAALVATAVLGTAAVYFVTKREIRREFTVAVLPFDSASQAQDDAVIAEGLVEELTTRLAGVESFRVLAQTSSRLLKAAKDPLAEARAHKVDAIVEGSVVRIGGTARISARLISTATGYHLWSERYERDTRDQFFLQDELAFNITQALQARVGLTARRSAPRAVDPEAVRLYWTGRYVRRQGRPDAMSRSAEFFEQAVALDPRYADAWAAAADVYALMGYHQTSGRSTGEYVRLARTAAARALEIDKDSTQAHVALAHVAFFFDRDWQTAEQRFRRTLALNPSDYQTHQRYAFALASRGRFEDALSHSRAAAALDPLSAGISNDLGVLLYIAGRYDEAVAVSMHVLSADPDFAPAHALVGICHSARGRFAEAIAEYKKAIAMSGRYSYLIGRLGHDEALAGHREVAVGLLRELTEAPDQSAVSYVHVAYILTGLGEYDRAVEALEQAAGRYDADVIYMGVDPGLDRLRARPGFVRLLESLRLPNLRAPR